MPPNNTETTLLKEKCEESSEMNFLEISGIIPARRNKNDIKTTESKRQPLIWSNIILITIFHIVAAYCLVAYVYKIKFLTLIWGKC